ncbi:MAG: substrate-binding domain-containing protein [Candidatus Tectomicrobia bacterium]|nr:substrate-binding domain-containing protein [Candidatus Tectomicrobia bacterium]
MWRAFLLFALLTLLLGSHSAAAPNAQRLRLATTTSTENSGLLAVLLPPFERQSGLRVDVIAVGTGKALKLAERGDVDVVLVHAPQAEEAFMAAGFGVNRRAVMVNDFVILGPPADAAGTRSLRQGAEALRKIVGAASPFVSRGDESGTHQREKALWKAAGIEPRGAWYLSIGRGMGESLMLANEKRAYVLTDRGTYLAYRGRLDLAVLVEGDAALLNPYSIIAVNPARHRQANYRGAMALIAWVTSVEGQEVIRGLRRFGQPLFTPTAVPE